MNNKINDFVEQMNLNQAVPFEEFRQTVKEAYKDRARQVWFIYKKMKELYPEIDAERVIREASWDFGVYQGEKIVEKLNGSDNIGPAEALLGQTSKGGMAVFDQEIMELSTDRAVKYFRACPHVEAIRELGASAEEIKMFCRDMIGACDYGIVDPFENCEITFPTTVADGENEPCRMIISRKKE